MGVSSGAVRRTALALVLLMVLGGVAAALRGRHKSGPAVVAPPEPNGARAFADLQAQIGCGPRVPSTQGAECGRDLILSRLRGHAHRVAMQRFALADPYGSDSLRLVNIEASFHVQRPARVLLGAHYDSRPHADRDTGIARDKPVPGANDGASGVAVLLEVARLLETWDPGLGVDLVFFDGEDYGHESDLQYYCLGSKHFVETMGSYRPRAMILLDMIGDRDLRIPMEAYSLRSAPELTKLVFSVADSLHAPGFVSQMGPALYDDHIPFLKVGIPALDLIDFDYPAWHTTRDLPDQCSPESLASVAHVLLHSLARLGRLHLAN